MTTATVQVQYGSSGSDPFAVLEPDDTLNLDADGQVLTSFDGSGPVWFVFHCQPGFGPGQSYCSMGMITDCGPVQRPRSQDDVVWTPEQTTIELAHYPAGAITATWEGVPMTLQLPSGRRLGVVETDAIGRADLSYAINATLYRWDPPSALVLADDEELGVEILIKVVAL